MGDYDRRSGLGRRQTDEVAATLRDVAARIEAWAGE
jgi:hypothetical protein